MQEFKDQRPPTPSQKGGEPVRTWGSIVSENDDLGAQHRDWDQASAQRTKSGLVERAPKPTTAKGRRAQRRAAIREAGLDRLPSGSTPESRLEPTLAKHEPRAIGEYINHRQD